MRLRDIVRDDLLFGKDEREKVAAKFDAQWSEGGAREATIICTKFKQLYCKRKHTGDPFIPTHMHTAVDLQ